MTSGAVQQVLRVRQDGLVWREVDQEVVVLDVRQSLYVTLNRSGRRLWLALTEGATVPALVGLLREQYGLDEERAQRDVNAFVSALRDQALLA